MKCEEQRIIANTLPHCKLSLERDHIIYIYM